MVSKKTPQKNLFKAGDFGTEQNFDFDASKDDDLITDYKFSYPLLMEAQIRKLKLSFEKWREIILPLKEVFLWEKQWHPTALIGVSTILFTLLWLLDPSVLTLVSMIGLILTLCDYLVPSLASSLFKVDKWNGKKEKDFEDLCVNLILYKAKLELAWASYYKMKITNRKMYFIITIVFLSLMAWIGCTFNNLFLAYLGVTFILLYPGMEHHGMITKWTETLQSIICQWVTQAKSKFGQKKEN